MSVTATPSPAPTTFTLPSGVLAAIESCHFGPNRTPAAQPETTDFLRAENLGFIRRHPTWHATPQGIGVLVAAGLLAGSPTPERATVHLLWCMSRHGIPHLVTAFPDDLVASCPELYRQRRDAAEVEYAESLDPDDRTDLRFFITVALLDRPTPPEADHA